MTKRAWRLALTLVLLGAGSAAQAALVPLTLGGVDVVCDDDYTPVGASSPGLIWTADANLFKTQYDADNTVVAQIIAAVPTISSGNGPHTVVAGDFNTSNGGMTWYGAMAWAEWLGITNYGGANDWRLWSAKNSDGSGPSNIISTDSELGHLFYIEGGLTQGEAITSSPALTNVFTNMQNFYWSGTDFPPVPVNAWFFFAGGGNQYFGRKDLPLFGWAVRPGQCTLPPPPSPQSIPAISIWGLGALSLLLMVLARARLR